MISKMGGPLPSNSDHQGSVDISSWAFKSIPPMPPPPVIAALLGTDDDGG